MADQILGIAKALETMGLGRSSLHRRVKAGDFPPPLRLGGDNSRAVGWLRSEVDDWIASRPRATETPHGPPRNGSKLRPPSN